MYGWRAAVASLTRSPSVLCCQCVPCIRVSQRRTTVQRTLTCCTSSIVNCLRSLFDMMAVCWKKEGKELERLTGQAEPVMSENERTEYGAPVVMVGFGYHMGDTFLNFPNDLRYTTTTP